MENEAYDIIVIKRFGRVVKTPVISYREAHCGVRLHNTTQHVAPIMHCTNLEFFPTDNLATS